MDITNQENKDKPMGKMGNLADAATDTAPETTGDENETTTEQTGEAKDPNGELTEIINRFAPGADTSTPEGLLAGATQVLQAMTPIYDKLYDLAKTNPETASMINDWLETGSLPKAIARNFDPEEISALTEEINDEENESDRTAYLDKVAAGKQRDTELADNQKQSQITAQQFIDKVNPNEDELEAFIKYHDEFLKDAVDNKMTLDHWMRAWKGFKYDGDLAEAENNGRIAGRNEKLATEKMSRKDLPSGMPDTGGGGSVANKEERPKAYGAKFMNGVF